MDASRSYTAGFDIWTQPTCHRVCLYICVLKIDFEIGQWFDGLQMLTHKKIKIARTTADSLISPFRIVRGFSAVTMLMWHATWTTFQAMADQRHDAVAANACKSAASGSLQRNQVRL